MSQDSSIHDQTYAFFQIEAPELLQSIEENLFTLREDRTPQKVHHLMRMTHTLKGAAASVGLKTIREIAHSLEDVFKALYNPAVVIDPELETLLFQGYEMLREPLTAELAGFPFDHQTALQQATQVFTSLHEKLGNAFDEQAVLPSSAELGFDLTESIFETGMLERLNTLSAIQAEGIPTQMAQALQEQATVFIGLAESLSLPGFGAIATATLAAIANDPQRVMEIAQVAIADFKAGRAAVLGGDRSQGGTVSPALQTWAETKVLTAEPIAEFSPAFDAPVFDPSAFAPIELLPVGAESSVPEEASLADLFTAEPMEPSLVDLFATEPVAEPSLADLFTTEPSTPDLFTPEQIITPEQTAESPLEASLVDLFTAAEPMAEASSADLSLADLFTAEATAESSLADLFTAEPEPLVAPDPVVSTDATEISEPPTLSTVKPRSKEEPSQSKTIRVEINKLKQLDYLTGELLTQQNHQDKTNQQLDEIAQQLQAQVESHRQLLQNIRDWADRLLIESQGNTAPGALSPSTHNPFRSLLSAPPQTLFAAMELDAMEFDPYGELHVLLQSALEETVQLEESAEAVKLFYQRSSQSLDKQKLLLTDVRENLAKVRMVPAQNLFQRFDRMVHQLSATYGKPVELQISGTQVLVDRFLVEKLYDPILHLLRNGFDHGLESPEERQNLGKPAVGTLSLHAQRRDRWVVITVRDDGQGIDYDKILSRAIDKQLLTPEDANDLTEGKLLACLFEPGFSTAPQLSHLSGRGIGLDVVKSQVEALEGWISVQSQPFQGTTFSLHLPYELNIAKVIICQSKSQIYAFLAESIEQVVIPRTDQVIGFGETRFLESNFAGEPQSVAVRSLATLLPYNIPLADNHSGVINSMNLINPFATKPLLILHHSEQRIALEVDQILGEQELMIRPVHQLIEAPSAVMGCCVLADGHLALLLDGTTFLSQVFASSLPSNPPLVSALSTWVGTDVDFAPEPIAYNNPTILVVDDSITLRQNLVLTLEKAGYAVFQARDGQDALDQLYLYPRIGLVICDVEMPRMNGFEFLSRRSQDPTFEKIPVIMLTSRSGHKHYRIAHNLGANGYLTKPYLDQELLDKVGEFLPPPTSEPVANPVLSWAV